jgi:putative glutamine amidotransferase
MRPVIGITCGYQVAGDGEAPSARLYLAGDYADAVLAAGGLPLPLAVPPEPDAGVLDELLTRSDGLLFTGGPDLDPRAYGQPPHAQTRPMHPRRQAFELALLRRADAARVPILAICLGFQVAHVARGGALVQHVPDVSAVPHQGTGGQSAWHPVRIAADSRLAQVVGTTELEVNSRHHQGVRPEEAGRGLRAVAHSPDGLLEGAEDCESGRFLLAVQWHPENLADRPAHLRLFAALVEQAGRRM